MRLFLCAPFHIANLWHWVEPGIRALNAKCADDFSPEDVYWYLRENRASLLLIFVENEFRGFVVVEISTDPFKGIRRFCVWLLYFPGAKEFQIPLMRYLKDMKRAVNCRDMEFKSPRGWDRVAEQLGFKLHMQTWRAE